MSSYNVDNFSKDQVERVQRDYPNLIESKVDVLDDFSIFRFLRKGFKSRATEAGVCSREIDLINRWRKMENKGKRTLPMRDYYLDLLLVKKRLLRYSQCL